MPYAAENQVSTDPLDGGIEITHDQYQQAIVGMLEGKVVTIAGGFAVVDPPKPEDELAPEPEPLPPQYPRLTALEMLDQFTEAEQLAVVAATMTAPAIKLWYDRLIAATYVTYEDPRTESGLQALVDAELITPQRKAEIVAAMQPEET